MKKTLSISLAARSSPLSRAQVQEVHQELLSHHPHIEFEPIYVETVGDKDRSTSLRSLEKTDFFTKEVDELLLNHHCRLAIHSAKDLPDPLPDDLVIAAITHGLDPADVLVLRSGETLEQLPSDSRIATSSERREEAVRELRHDLRFCDLRGTIHERLSLLDQGAADGVVIAEAALIRLGLTHLNRIRLPGKTTPFQGQLALVCRKSDLELIHLLNCLDSRHKKKSILYLGLDLPKNKDKGISWIHYPIIRIHFHSSHEPSIQISFEDILQYTHILFTSKSAVHAFFKHCSFFKYSLNALSTKSIICVGEQTAETVRAYGYSDPIVSTIETAEGMVDILKKLSGENCYFFWPHSSLSRPVISHFLSQKGWRFRECVLYDTEVNRRLKPIDLTTIDEIHFTSPSTVRAFIERFGSLPQDKMLKAIGPITEQELHACQN